MNWWKPKSRCLNDQHSLSSETIYQKVFQLKKKRVIISMCFLILSFLNWMIKLSKICDRSKIFVVPTAQTAWNSSKLLAWIEPHSILYYMPLNFSETDKQLICSSMHSSNSRETACKKPTQKICWQSNTKATFCSSFCSSGILSTKLAQYRWCHEWGEQKFQWATCLLDRKRR